MHRLITIGTLLTFTACTLPQPDPPALPPAPPPRVTAPAPELLTLQQDVQVLRSDIAVLEERVYSLEALPERVAQLEAIRATLKTLPRKPPPAPAPPSNPTPVQLITYAQQQARVQPSSLGYHGLSGEHSYSYSPGRIYTIYLSPNHGTGLFFPPSEQMVAGLLLNPDEFEVKNERAGVEPLTYDAINIRPKVEKGEFPCFVLMASGKRFLLNLVVGKVGMIAVSFESAPITQAQREEPKLILPKPQP